MGQNIYDFITGAGIYWTHLGTNVLQIPSQAENLFKINKHEKFLFHSPIKLFQDFGFLKIEVGV